VPEPSAALGRALGALADALGGAELAGDGDRDAAVLNRLRTASGDHDAPAALARAVLRSALEARLDARAGRSRRG
jgi:hypothetical protein